MNECKGESFGNLFGMMILNSHHLKKRKKKKYGTCIKGSLWKHLFLKLSVRLKLLTASQRLFFLQRKATIHLYDKVISTAFEAHYLLTTPKLSEAFSLRHIGASASNNAECISDQNTQGIRKSVHINIWLAGESNTHFSSLSSISVGLVIVPPWFTAAE